jgi:hypothetical protein
LLVRDVPHIKTYKECYEVKVEGVIKNIEINSDSSNDSEVCPNSGAAIAMIFIIEMGSILV